MMRINAMIFLEIVLKDYKVQDKNILITYIDQNDQYTRILLPVNTAKCG